MPIFERNSMLYIILILFSIFLAIAVNPALLLLWPIALLVDDLAYFKFGRSIFDSDIMVQRGYQFADWFLNDISGHGRDLGFNLYDGNMSKTKKQSQMDKWDVLLDKLKLKPGDKLMDVGCGYGDWLNYARSKGLEVVGINISPEQSIQATQNFGLTVYNVNWKDVTGSRALSNALFNQFDAVTFMDTVEHYVPSKFRHNNKKKSEIYTQMFELAANLLKNNPKKKGRVFISCLHMIRPPRTFRDYFSCYLQTRYHSGFYPEGNDGLTQFSHTYFTELERSDKTEDYRLTSVLDPDHFGAAKIRWSMKKVSLACLAFFLDPHHIHKWLEYQYDAWMWHFGNHAYARDYDNDYQKGRRHVTLWWLVLEKNAP